jgi:tRNA-specific 2-thiouridylase
VHRFTVGQRKGIGVALGERVFVTSVDAESGDVHLGPAEDLDVASLEADEARFAADAPREFDARVKVRARHEGEDARVRRLDDGRIEIRFAKPVRAVNVGQFAVAYVGDRIVGGARIAEVFRAESPT